MNRSTWWNIGFMAAFVVGGWLAGRRSEAAVPTPDVTTLQQEVTALTTRVTAVESAAQGCFAHDSGGNWTFAPKAGSLLIQVPGNITTKAQSNLTLAGGTATSLSGGATLSLVAGAGFTATGATMNLKGLTSTSLSGTPLTLAAGGPLTETGTPISLNGKNQ
jgi:hypothetical protein